MASRQRTSQQEFRDQRDAELLKAASRTLRQWFAVDQYAPGFGRCDSGYNLCGVLDSAALSVDTLPQLVRSSLCQLAQQVQRDAEGKPPWRSTSVEPPAH